MALVTLADLKTFMGIDTLDVSQDAIITIFQDAVEQTVINYCDTDFTIQTVTNERHDLQNSDILTPENYPITSVDAVYLGIDTSGSNGILLDPTLYDWDEGAIYFRDEGVGRMRRGARVDYKWGYSAVPPDVKMAIYYSVKAMLQRHNKNAEDTGGGIQKKDESQTAAGTGNAKAGSVWDAMTGLPSAAVALIQNYRTFEFPAAGMAQRNR